MPLSLLNHSALALFAQRTRIPTSARSIGFCAIWVCISSTSSSFLLTKDEVMTTVRRDELRVIPSGFMNNSDITLGNSKNQL